MAGGARVVVDVDVGTDDYLALLVLLHADGRGDIKIEGIVCTAGNTTIENVCVNVVRLLETVGRTDIPVWRGAGRQFIPIAEGIDSNFHGADGFGGLEYETQPDVSVIRKGPAAAAVADLVLRNPGEITLICLAPLTNLALSLRLYDDFAGAIKELWIMGGNYTARGNVTSTAEFNFYFDPEAAFIVLESITKPIFILTWETCLYPKIPMDWRFNVFGVKNNPAIQLLTKADRNIYRKSDFWLPCDAFLAAAFVNPGKIITKTSRHNASIELHGSQTRGQVVLDHSKTKKENVTIIEQINTELFQEMLMQL
ncbi:hypothetical protein Zmor_016833 [Zophobas morio]|uniref:Inosine/uridine-preferring nucleoside hydrolase domain-containing protein n=1 Tax=Zophobas morio TaxID=2755281 RepID=A0AA38MBV0_9CUCU|nr:hypothetical protein Zmor_016833 [Zophobas morio]